MRERRFILLFVLFVLIGTFNYSGMCLPDTIYNTETKNSNQNNDLILAEVGSHKITTSEFANRYSDYLISSGVNDNLVVRYSILNNMINEILLYYYDDNKSIFNNSDYKKELDWSKKQVVLSYLKDKEIYAKINVSDEELRKAFYRVNESISARHLFARTEEEANLLYNLVKQGVDWDYLAALVFSDSTLKNNGGNLGYFTWGDMDPAFEEAAYSLKVGEISQPVKTSYGWSIIKLEDRKPNPILTEWQFANNKQRIERVLKISKKKPAERAYLNQIFDFNKVQFNEKLLNQILDNLKILSELSSDKIEQNKKISSSDLVCAEYEGSKYSQREIENRINEIPYYHKQKINSLENLKAVIKGLLLQDKLLAIAKEKGYEKNSEVLDIYNKLAKNVFLEFKFKELRDNYPVSDSAASKYYYENIHIFQTEEEMSIQEVLVDSKNLADSLKKILEKGEDFGAIARKFSLRKLSSENNGIIGYAPKSTFGMLKDTLWNSELNKLIGPFQISQNELQGEGLYGIFKVIGKKESQPIEFSLIKEQVINMIRMDYQRKIIDEKIKDISKNVNIKINDNAIKNLSVLG